MSLLYKENVTQVCQKPEMFIKFLKKTIRKMGFFRNLICGKYYNNRTWDKNAEMTENICIM